MKRLFLASEAKHPESMQKLEDFEDLLAMKESLAAPEGEAISLKDYEAKRAARVRG